MAMGDNSPGGSHGAGMGGNSGGNTGMGDPGKCCFIANTQILLADGTHKFIQDIEIGDVVLGKDESKNKVTGIEAPVLGSRSLYSFNGGKAFVTSEHPFWTPHGWAALDPKATAEHHEMDVLPLYEGDSLLRSSGRWMALEKIDDHDGSPEEVVYNLMLDGTHTYFADGYLVHNKERRINFRDLLRVRDPYNVSAYTGGNENVNNFLNQNFDVASALSDLNSRRNRKGIVNRALWDIGTENVNNLAYNREIAGRELENRLNRVSQYNTAVEGFNTQAQDYYAPLQSTYDFLNDANIAGFENFNYQGPSLEDIEGLATPDRPTFSNPIGRATFDINQYDGNSKLPMGRGAATPLNLSGFDLDYVDPFDTGQLSGLYDSTQQLMGTLGGELSVEQDRNREFLNQYDADLSGFDRRLDRADIYDEGELDALYGRYDELLGGLDRYDSPLQSFEAAQSQLRPRLDEFGNELGGFQTQYDTERSRVDDFIKMLDTERLGLDMDIDDFTIADIDQIGAADDEISALANQVIGFDSPIDVDLSNYLNQLEGLDDELDYLRRGRESELSSIRGDQRAYQGQLRDLNRVLSEADPYRGSVLTGARGNLDSLRDAIQYYDSPLAAEADFSGVETGISSAEEALNALFADRTNQFGSINDAIAAAETEATGAELYDEDTMRNALRELENQRATLGRFSGSGVDPLRDLLSSSEGLIDSRLDELGEYRGGIEENAQQLLDNFLNTQFYGDPEVTGAREQLDPVIAERDLYGATQANDEIQAMLDMLAGEESRLSEDEQSRLARDESAQRRQLQGLFGVPRDYVVNQLATGTVTPEEYQILLGKVRERDPEFANLIQEQYDALLA